MSHSFDTESASPIRQMIYSHSHHETEFLEGEIDKVLAFGVICTAKEFLIQSYCADLEEG